MCDLKAPHVTSTALLSSHKTITFRFIKFSKGRFSEVKENGTRNFRSHSSYSALIAGASNRALKYGGALVIYDAAGLVINWAV